MSEQFSLLYGMQLSAPRPGNEKWVGIVRVAWAGKEKRLSVEGDNGDEVSKQLLLAATAYVEAVGWPPIR